MHLALPPASVASEISTPQQTAVQYNLVCIITACDFTHGIQHTWEDVSGMRHHPYVPLKARQGLFLGYGFRFNSIHFPV